MNKYIELAKRLGLDIVEDPEGFFVKTSLWSSKLIKSEPHMLNLLRKVSRSKLPFLLNDLEKMKTEIRKAFPGTASSLTNKYERVGSLVRELKALM